MRSQTLSHCAAITSPTSLGQHFPIVLDSGRVQVEATRPTTSQAAASIGQRSLTCWISTILPGNATTLAWEQAVIQMSSGGSMLLHFSKNGNTIPASITRQKITTAI